MDPYADLTTIELRALIPDWKLQDVPDDASDDDLREILREIDADDPPLTT
jgi:hypothetical protein